MSDWTPSDWDKIKETHKRNTDKRCGGKMYAKTYAEIAVELCVSERTIRDYIQNGVPDHKVLAWCESTGEKPEDVAPHIYPPCCNSVIGQYVRRWKD